MTFLRFPAGKRGYLLGTLAGIATLLGASVIGRLLIFMGLHADLTYLDDGLLGVLVALLVFALHNHHDSERREQQAMIAHLIALHEGIAADLQMIGAITGNTALAEIANEAAGRIRSTIAELPPVKELAHDTNTLGAHKTHRRLVSNG